jgi:hypothetical protein
MITLVRSAAPAAGKLWEIGNVIQIDLGCSGACFALID